ncbi:hypothetical protein ACFY36_15080 [Actinoplanes sp. NPDC000266]
MIKASQHASLGTVNLNPRIYRGSEEPPYPIAEDEDLVRIEVVSNPRAVDVKQDLVDVIDLPQFRGFWIEYGVVEWAYATGPGVQDFLALLEPPRWHIVHPARGLPKGAKKTVSQYLANPLLSQLNRAGRVRLYPEKMPGTGFWGREEISWWSSVQEPAPDWNDETTRLSWERNLALHPDATPEVYVP